MTSEASPDFRSRRKCCRNNGSLSVGLLYRRVQELNLYVSGNYGPIGTVDLFTGLPSETKSTTYTVLPGDLPE